MVKQNIAIQSAYAEVCESCGSKHMFLADFDYFLLKINRICGSKQSVFYYFLLKLIKFVGLSTAFFSDFEYVLLEIN